MRSFYVRCSSFSIFLLFFIPQSSWSQIPGLYDVQSVELNVSDSVVTQMIYDSLGYVSHEPEYPESNATSIGSVEDINTPDTSLVKEDATGDSSDYIPLSEFTYAGDRRVTIDGSLPRNSTKIRPLPFIGLASIYLGITTALHIYQVNTFWDSTTTFRFIEDGDYALYADKYGHAWGTFINAYLASEALMGAGFSWESATLGGAGIALAYQTYVEVMDGYGKTWGFSWSDMYANFAGLAWFLGQHYVPFLQNFTYKANFFPPPWFGRAKREMAETFLDDYSGWTFTLAIDVHNLLPQKAKHYWPSWLNIDIGHAVRDLRFREGESVYTLGLDINPVRLLPDGSNLINWFRQGLNYVKIPAPAIEFGKETRFRLFYPFQLQIGPIRF